MPLNVPPVAEKRPPDHGVLSHMYRDCQMQYGHTTLSDFAAMTRKAESPTYAFRVRGDFAIERR